jgi:hypothetical protein
MIHCRTSAYSTSTGTCTSTYSTSTSTTSYFCLISYYENGEHDFFFVAVWKL